MIRETAYQEIFDSQRHFRTLLDAMARPGKIDRFATVAITPPPPLTNAAACTALALLDSDSTFDAAPLGPDAIRYVQVNTGARAVPVAEADFVFLDGGDVASAERIAAARAGIPTYPETGATIVLQVSRLSHSSGTGGLELTLSGPGIETTTHVVINGLHARNLEALGRRNREFPLGVDAIVTADDGGIICLPRTTRVAWATV